MEFTMSLSSIPALMTTEQVAKILGLSARTLETLRLRGGGPEYIKLGRSVRYEHGDIENWIEARRTASTSEDNV